MQTELRDRTLTDRVFAYLTHHNEPSGLVYFGLAAGYICECTSPT